MCCEYSLVKNEASCSGSLTPCTLFLIVLKDRLNAMWRHKERVVVVASSRSRSTLHSKLTATHGVHMFHITEEIPSLNQVSVR